MDISYLDRGVGRISYNVTGDGPLVVAVPGMGDLRDSYRELVAPLVAAGYRVAVTDLRGHCDSDTTFREHGDEATAGDLLALIDELGGPAILIGNSMGGSAAIIAADERPDAVRALVLLSPFARELASPGALRTTRLLYHLLFARPWGAGVWSSFYGSRLNLGAKAPWLPEHVAAIRTSMRQPGRLRSFRELTLQLEHTVVEPHVAGVTQPVLALIGALDPDYRDQVGELAWLREHLHAETELVEDAAHYVHTQRPDVVVPRILSFLAAKAPARA